jgi:hypothetical protein
MNVGVWIPNDRHLATPDVIKTAAISGRLRVA